MFIQTAAVAAALTATTPSIVPPGGSVAGRDYGAWMARSWQYQLNHNDAPKPCVTIKSAGRPVTLLLASGSGKVTVDCTVPAGQPLYLTGLAAECSDIESPPFTGKTPAKAKACAQRIFERGSGGRAVIDGRRVRHLRRFAVVSPTFRYHLAQKVPGVHGRSGRGAAYGVGVLLRGLPAGSHTVEAAGGFPDFKFKGHFVYRLTVTG